MLTFVFFFSIFFISLIGIGFQFNKFFFNFYLFSLGELILIGLFVVSFFLTFLHLFLPISDLVNILILLIGIIFFFRNFQKIFEFILFEKYLIILLSIVSIFLFFNYEPNEDFGLYHLPYVINFKSEKIIVGLSNLQINQGWNSLWLNLHTFFSFKFNEFKTIYILNILFYISINLIFFKNIFNSNSNKESDNPELLIKYFSIFFFSYLNIKFSRLNSYGIDVPSNFLLILSILYFFKILYHDENKLSNLKFIYMLVVFAFMCRISNALFIFLPIYLTFKFNFFPQIIKLKFFIFILIFSSTWVIQQFLYTGCIVFPYKFFCSIEPLWYNPNFIQEFKNATFFVNKSFSSYVGHLNIETYHSFLNWVPNWFSRTKVEISEHLFTFLIPVFFLIFRKKKNIKNLFNLLFFNKSIITLLFIILLSFILWFLNSPVVRMGVHFSFLFLFFPVFLVLNYFGQLRYSFKKKSIYLLIISTFIFVISKNIMRVDGELLKKNIFPSFPDIKYVTEKKNYNFNINKVKEGNSIQSRVCWNTPFLCTTNDDFEVKTINSYIFIIKK